MTYWLWHILMTYAGPFNCARLLLGFSQTLLAVRQQCLCPQWIILQILLAPALILSCLLVLLLLFVSICLVLALPPLLEPDCLWIWAKFGPEDAFKLGKQRRTYFLFNLNVFCKHSISFSNPLVRRPFWFAENYLLRPLVCVSKRSQTQSKRFKALFCYF